MSKSKLIGCVVMAALALAGCRQDMHNNPKFKVYREDGMRQPPAGTVARGSLAANPPAPASNAAQLSAIAVNNATAGVTTVAGVPTGENGFPFKVTAEVLERGRERFNITCSPCHGRLGDGQGMIALRGLKNPPSYHTDRLRQAPDSYFFDVVTNGFGLMRDYAAEVTPEDRWKIVAYLRALQLSQRADFVGLPDDQKAKVQSAATAKPATQATPAKGAH